jgi:O-antigen/teichoic acid export membrane protein
MKVGTGSLRQIAQGTVVLTAFQFASKALLAVFFILLGNRSLFGEEPYGRLEGLLALVNLFLLFSDFGLETYTTRQLSRERDSSGEWLPPQVSTKALLTGTASFLLLAWLFIVEGVFKSEWDYPSWCACVVLLAALSAQSYLRGITRAHSRMEVEGMVGVVEKSATLALGLAALFILGGLSAVVWAFAIGSLAGAAYALVQTRAMEQGLRLAWPLDKRVLSRSFFFALSAICVSLFFNMDRVLLGLWSDLAVAPYARGLRIVWAILLFPQMMSIAAYPVLSRLKDLDVERLHVARTSLRALLFLGFPLAIGGCVVAGGLMDLLFRSAAPGSPEWLLDQPLGWDSLLGNTTESACLRVLLLGLPFTCGNYLFGPALNALDREAWNLKASALAMVVNFGLNLLLIPFLGPVGSALATTLTQALYCLSMYRYLRQMEGSWLVKNQLVILLAVSLGMGALLVPLSSLHVMLRILIGGLVYGAATGVLGLWPVRRLF